ncbi:hypothetical protein K5D34_19815 [Pseudomonas cichorii]|nr:hypothetical protein [Pseudomonas cichorii]MBX8511934.1 hypothetical protein [Pseudomonas cichorii]MBX8526684.1 hypothetical protein [Pseudomonas cichorii]
MRKLLDVSGDSASRRWFDAQGVANPGIHPKADAVQFEDAIQGVAATNKIGKELPELGQLDLPGGTAPQTQQDFQTLSNIIGQKPKGTFENLGDSVASNIATSPLGSLLRYGTMEDANPLDWVNPQDTSNWTAEDYEMIRREGVDPQFFSFVQDFAKGNRANLPNAIAMAKENQEYQRKINGAGFGAQIVGGVSEPVWTHLCTPPEGGLLAFASFPERPCKPEALTHDYGVTGRRDSLSPR